jgi:molecular chaperone GrpE
MTEGSRSAFGDRPGGPPQEPKAGDLGEPDAPGDRPDEPAVTSEPGGGTILTDAAGLAAERDEYLVALQRLQADFENYRKRVLRQQEEQSARAALDLVGKVLPVLDTLDLARAHLASGEADGTGESGAPVSEEARALLQAREQLLDVLAKEGLARVDEVDIEFDPVVHDAVAHAPAAEDGEGSEDGGGVIVDEVMRAGYRWRGQVLRPAMVRVRG